MRPPNILIIMPDQLRADTLGCSGNPVVRTPNIDRLAGEGVRFTRAYTVSPICMSARASFVSGLYPHNHHMWTNSGSLPAEDETFFHHLQRCGYYTAHIGKSHFYPHRGEHLREHEGYMHARGLDYVHETTGPWATARTDSYMTDHWRKKGLLEAFREDYERRRRVGPKAVWPSPLPAEEFLDSYIGRKAVEFLESYDGGRPFCLFVGFGGPHPPWDAPGEYADMYSPDEVPPPMPIEKAGDWVPDYALGRMREGIVDASEGDFRRMKANYYGKVSLIDHWVGEILRTLERRGWSEETLVVFWSDHGEMLGNHGRLGKVVFYESSSRVPLIIRYPGRVPAGVTSHALVEIVDVFPTLLEAAGAEPSERCLGRSLWKVLERPDSGHRKAVFGEIFASGSYNFMVRTDRYKYAMDDAGRGYMLYDLWADPEERENLVGRRDMKKVEEEHRELILRFLVGNQIRYGPEGELLH